MRKKSGPESMRGVKKATNSTPASKIQKGSQQNKPARIKFDESGDFLRQRMGKKVRQLRLEGALGAAAAPSGGDDAMGDDPAPSGAASLGAASLGGSIESLQAKADRQADEFEEEEEEEEEAGYANASTEVENNRKKFYRECRKVIQAADIVIEVLDARDPLSCRCDSLERDVLNHGKKLVLLLNKIDLVPKPAVVAWLAHLKRAFPTVAFKSAHGGAKSCKHAMTSLENAPEGLLSSTHAVVGADELMQLVKNYSRSGGTKMKAHVTVGIVGYPNTGKSSVINSMKRQNCVEAGGKAGVTKILQEVKLDSKVTLIDSPGVVFEGSSDDPSVVLRNAVRVEGIGDPVGVVEALLKKSPREAVIQFYGLTQDYTAVHDFLVFVAQSRGKLKRGSGLDLESAARSVISDWTSGRFRYYTMPPVVQEALPGADTETAEVLQTMAPAFDIDALLSGDGGAAMPAVLGAPAARPDDEDMGDDDEADAPVHFDMSSL